MLWERQLYFLLCKKKKKKKNCPSPPTPQILYVTEFALSSYDKVMNKQEVWQAPKGQLNESIISLQVYSVHSSQYSSLLILMSKKIKKSPPLLLQNCGLEEKVKLLWQFMLGRQDLPFSGELWGLIIAWWFEISIIALQMKMIMLVYYCVWLLFPF